jgi:hypothetical protein
MAGVDGTYTEWGIALTCTSGTGANSIIVPTVASGRNTQLRIKGIAMTGAATTDKVILYDGYSRWFWSGVAPYPNGSASIIFNPPIKVDGLIATIQGATTGWCAVYCE